MSVIIEGFEDDLLTMQNFAAIKNKLKNANGNITVNKDVINMNAGNILINKNALNAHLVDYNNPHKTTIDNLLNTTITAVGDNEILQYDSGSSKWINQTFAEAGIFGVPAGLTDNYLPKWDSGTSAFEDSLVFDDGTTISFAGHIDIASGKNIYMGSDAVIKRWVGNRAMAIGKQTGADKMHSYYFGDLCGYFQTGTYFVGQGFYAGGFQSGLYVSVQGHYCGRWQKGNYVSLQGYYGGDYQSGNFVNLQGAYAGVYQVADHVTGQGICFCKYNTGTYIFGGGSYSLQYNDADYATALGADSFNNFDEDVANEKTFDNTDIDVANDRITIVGHGFGANNSYRNLKFTQGTDVVPGLITATIHQFKIISVDIVEIITDTITEQGTGTGHKLTPQFIYTASTAVGYDSEPDAAYQVMLGDSNVTEVKTYGGFTNADNSNPNTFISQSRFGDAANYLQISTGGVVTLVNDARVRKDIWMNVESLKAPGTKPAMLVDYGIGDAWEFTDGTDDTIVTRIKFPEDLDKSAGIEVLIGWNTETASAGNCKWDVEYLFRQENEDMSVAADATLTATVAASATAKGFVLSSIGTTVAPHANDTCVTIRIKRRADEAADTLGEDNHLFGVCFGYVANKFGGTL